MKAALVVISLASSALAFAPVRPTVTTRQSVANQPLHLFNKNEGSTGLLEKPVEKTQQVNGAVEVAPEDEKKEENIMDKIKEAGTAGIISYIIWEWVFWLTSVPIAIFGYVQLAGHWPDFSNSEDLAYLGGEAFAVVNFARFVLPLRIGLALSTTPWVKDNIVDRFNMGKDKDEEA